MLMSIHLFMHYTLRFHASEIDADHASQFGLCINSLEPS